MAYTGLTDSATQQYILSGAAITDLFDNIRGYYNDAVGPTDSSGNTWSSGAKYITLKRGNGTNSTSIPIGSSITFGTEGSVSATDGTIKITVDGTDHYPKVSGISNLSVASATTASKLSNTSKIGDTNQPVYFTANGVPTAISYTIGASVPANAVFTDTATATDNILDGSNSGTAITYAPYTAQQSKLSFDTSSTMPARSDRLNLNGYFYATKVFNAVFNDYAEYRTTIDLTPGHVVIDQDNGSLACSTARLQPGAQVISDTYGTCMGQTFEATTPIAVAGRVLVYPYQARENYHAGMAVCSAPDGTVDIMTREEIKEYPDCIVGIVSEIPQYETWGSDNIKVDGRIWIKI